ncbi:carboxylesterase family protein [Actinacidiphila oryziradicis]|uniref:Carboxylic ester hydrolase n=1 Tax=Actinacidiphila oryziradicis TaxID=2571141 RepID=A0A4U0S3Y1_9ACTN|nr:carboxylesterase family protein [Actinacidiphila oryziradicis]TKA02928.1 carboxylesterase/lipase family protein [Actinacidiphila oryziradicis]
MGATAPLTVPTTSGRVRGFEERGVRAWHGIRYGRVEARFTPPVPERAAADVVDATRFGPISWQLQMISGGGQARGRIGRVPQESEDCLVLNVWAPADVDAPCPVLVWLHAGGGSSGSGCQVENPHVYAAEHGCVVVSLNWRLGPWGALDPGLESSANLGVRDQLLALRWLRDNIAAFGGDPDNLTLFGVSSGGTAVAGLLAVPSARPLFRRCAVYSGGGRLMSAEEMAEFADRFRTTAARVSDAITDLRTVPNVALRHIHNQLVAEHGFFGYRPYVDGELVPSTVVDALAGSAQTGLELLISVTAEEAAFLYYAPEPQTDQWYERNIPDPVPGLDRDEKVRALTKRLFHDPAERMSQAAAGSGAAVWRQLYDYHPTNTECAPRLPEAERRAHHAVDLKSLFYSAADETNTEADREVAVRVQRSLASFARTGDPGWKQWLPDRFDQIVAADTDQRREARATA